MIINGYNMSTDVAFLFVSCLMLFLMFRTKPRKTQIYFMNVLGFIYSICIIVIQGFILYQTRGNHTFHNILFNFLCLAFYIIYIGILCVIFFYIIQLASNRNEIKQTAGRLTVLVAVIFNVTAAYFCLSGKMYYVTDLRRILLSKWFYSYIVLGIFDALMVLFVSIINRKKISKIILFFVYLFCPIEVIFLVLQMNQSRIFFSSITYVVPFILFYLLFHSNPYDENSGCQNAYSFETRFLDYVRYHCHYMVICVMFPTLQNELFAYTDEELQLALADACRKIERIERGIHLYYMKTATYAVVVRNKDRKRQREIFDQLRELLEKEIIIQGRNIKPKFKLLGFFDNKYVENMSQVRAMVQFLLDKTSYDMSSECYLCKEEDYELFAEHYQIYLMLLDIVNQKNLDDERVLCYVQPIYAIRSNNFITAEALMRLSMKGKMIYPDKFIRLAEENNCIHILTCIILNKVCKKIKELENKYSFDAITVNCSTLEFSNPELHKELLNIIKENGISPSKIRLELTESAMYSDYEIVLHNMAHLKKEGVEFYLDDFGTGYSNLERIASCPFMTVKFDKSLLYKAVIDEKLNTLLGGMVQVFKSQGLVLLIEGVEDEKQRDYCIRNDFDYIQGYYYAKPIPIEQLVEFFDRKII